jgi:DNA modification methylase
MNKLYYGDNLEILRKEIKDESVDLVYLDPPFNSNATYNVLFKAHSGKGVQAQIDAFEDTWHWGEHAEAAYANVRESGNMEAFNLLRAMRTSLRESDMMAYLAMMSVRLIELRRVLKSTGSLYLHCDPTASHYLKIMMDSIFGPTIHERFKHMWVLNQSNTPFTTPNSSPNVSGPLDGGTDTTPIGEITILVLRPQSSMILWIMGFAIQ